VFRLQSRPCKAVAVFTRAPPQTRLRKKVCAPAKRSGGASAAGDAGTCAVGRRVRRRLRALAQTAAQWCDRGPAAQRAGLGRFATGRILEQQKADAPGWQGWLACQEPGGERARVASAIRRSSGRRRRWRRRGPRLGTQRRRRGGTARRGGGAGSRLHGRRGAAGLGRLEGGDARHAAASDQHVDVVRAWVWLCVCNSLCVCTVCWGGGWLRVSVHVRPGPRPLSPLPLTGRAGLAGPVAPSKGTGASGSNLGACAPS
jgi:hypothetical protein